MKIKIPPDAPLHPLDTETQTYGCRASRPDYCNRCGLECCAFVSEDHICRKPMKVWKKRYEELIKTT